MFTQVAMAILTVVITPSVPIMSVPARIKLTATLETAWLKVS